MKMSKSYKTFSVFNIIFMILISFIFIAPYLNVLATALNDAKDSQLGGIFLWPRKWTWANISAVIKDDTTINGFIITILRTVIGSALALIVTYFAAYAFLRKGLRGRGFIMMYLTIPMFFSGGLVPTYITYANIKVYDTFFVYILPTAFNFFNMAVIRTFLMGIPDSLRESARIDGASELRILWTIMLPLSKPIVATILLWNAVHHWNDWTTTLYYVRSEYLYTLQYNLQLILKESSRAEDLINKNPNASGEIHLTSEALKAAQIIVTTLPILCVYPFVQRYFVQGVMIGSVKE